MQDEKQTTFAITADMTRQYKSMQEELMKRINTLETTIMEQKDQLELARQVIQTSCFSHCTWCAQSILSGLSSVWTRSEAGQVGRTCFLLLGLQGLKSAGP